MPDENERTRLQAEVDKKLRMRLLHLHRDINNSYVVRFFSSPDNLARLVAEKMATYE